MNILHDHERALGMRRGDHVRSRIQSLRGRAQKLRRYGVAGIVFNVALALGMNSSFARTPEVLAFGDSLTAGLGLPASEAFPVRLAARLKEQGVDVKMVNAGVSGDTTTDGLARLDWALADKPDFVMLALGANDALRAIDPKIVRANLDAMLTK